LAEDDRQISERGDRAPLRRRLWSFARVARIQRRRRHGEEPHRSISSRVS
jgi:hypothetical protein